MRAHCICEILRERNAQPFDVKIKIFYIFPSSRPCLKASNVPSKKQEAYIWNMLNIFGLLLQSRIEFMLYEFIDIWQNLNCYSWNNRWNRHKGSKYSREQYGNRMGDRVSTIWGNLEGNVEEWTQAQTPLPCCFLWIIWQNSCTKEELTKQLNLRKCKPLNSPP